MIVLLCIISVYVKTIFRYVFSLNTITSIFNCKTFTRNIINTIHLIKNYGINIIMISKYSTTFTQYVSPIFF